MNEEKAIGILNKYGIEYSGGKARERLLLISRFLKLAIDDGFDRSGIIEKIKECYSTSTKVAFKKMMRISRMLKSAGIIITGIGRFKLTKTGNRFIKDLSVLARKGRSS
jgi:predicted transcriptional regulator